MAQTVQALTRQKFLTGQRVRQVRRPNPNRNRAFLTVNA